MPELAEVEFNRKLWNCGLGRKILAVQCHATTRPFRNTPVRALEQLLPGSRLLGSEARGKQMLFRFSKGLWLGLHLGMTGRLRVEAPGFVPGKHDHLVLYQRHYALVFTDPRQFGRVRFHHGQTAPDWWTQMPLSLNARGFTVRVMQAFLERHRRLPLKAALLLQSGFPGIGNWMADEILWRARLHPRVPAGRIKNDRATVLWEKLKFVCRQALRHVGPTYAELPKGWLFHERWEKGGKCPRHGEPLCRATIAGRTTAWCPKCQP